MNSREHIAQNRGENRTEQARQEKREQYGTEGTRDEKNGVTGRNEKT
jgi:hypothetical protein